MKKQDYDEFVMDILKKRSVLREKIAQLFSFMHAARLAAAMFLNI